MKKIFSIVFLSLFFIFNLFSDEIKQKKSRIAILNFKAGEGVTSQEAEQITEFVRIEMIKNKSFIIIDRQNINKVLQEQKKIQQGICDTTACEVQIGKLLSANKILTGSITRFRSTFYLNASLTDVEKGTNDFADKESSPSLDQMDEACNKLVSKISDNLRPTYSNYQSDSENSDYLNSETSNYSSIKKNREALELSIFMPGVGQIYKKNYIKGSLITVAFFGLATFTYSEYSNYRQARENFDSTTALGTISFFGGFGNFGYIAFANQNYYSSEMQNSAQKIQGASALLVGVYIYNLIDIVFSKDNSTVQAKFERPRDSFFFNSKAFNSNQGMRDQIYNFGYTFSF